MGYPINQAESCSSTTMPLHLIPAVPDNKDFAKRIKVAEKMLPAGKRLAVVEPFYKVMRDGTRGIRVDNPKEVRPESLGLRV